MLSKCKVLIGNSSSGIREGAFIGTPCINLGNRQKDRERGPNVIDINRFEQLAFNKAIEKHLEVGKYNTSEIYGNGKAARTMIDIIKSINPLSRKHFLRESHTNFRSREQYKIRYLLFIYEILYH